MSWNTHMEVDWDDFDLDLTELKTEQLEDRMGELKEKVRDAWYEVDQLIEIAAELRDRGEL